MMSTAIQIVGMSKKYDGFCLKNISLDIPSSTIVGLIGQNGAGKSTLIKCLLHLVKRDSGQVTLPCVENFADGDGVRALVGYIPETLTFYDWMSVKRLIKFFSAYYPNWDHNYCKDLLDRYDLSTGKKVKHLSKGMRAKLALLLALSHKPPVLVLDEPTSGLDPVMKHNFLQELREAVSSGTTKAVLISSHILGEVEQVADRIAVLRSGELSLYAETSSLLSDWQRVSFVPPVNGGPISIEVAPSLAVFSDGSRVIVPKDHIGRVVELLERRGASEINVTRPDLQEIFLQLAS